MKIAFLAMILFALDGVFAAQPATLPTRQLKYPLKTARTLYTDEQIARARENIKKYPAAKKVADVIIKDADAWASWKDEDLTFLLTSPDVPRAFAVSATGCPVCGGKIRQKGNGDYNWIIDPKIPFKIKCPVDGTVFPTNDYAAYYRSGFTEKKDWDTQYVDDGWGWPDPKTGEKYWFVAYYNHWMWHKHLVPGLLNLGRAYMLTGDPKYAHTAAVMLHRIAQVYPGMDHAKQSRYGTMMAARGIDYPGKVVNKIWETSLAQSLADAYDAVWETFDRDEAIQKETGKTGEQIRSFIEANVLEDAIDAVFNGRIRGNFGMHQSCLVHLAIVRQTGDNKQWFDGLMNNSTVDYPVLGLNFALYNLISRDGVPSESAPGYNNIWIKKISEYGDLLQRGGVDVFGIPKTKRLYDGVIDQINIGKLTPSVGDSQSIWGGLVGADAETFQTAWRHYKDPRYAAFLAQMHATGPDSFKTFDSLFEEPIEAPPDAKLPPAKPRLLDGCGMAILNNPADTVSMSLEYGQHHGHGHYDRLTFEIFANGVPIMPDLGYPDAMNEFVPGIYTWSKNTVSHNTVVVDAGRQLGEGPGEVRLFANSEWARVVEVEAKETYPQCSAYRRAMIMIDAPGGKGSYFIDIFTVIGGKQHDYSLHGPPGDFQLVGGTWTNPAKGTLAGENVELGQIYDNPELAAHGEKSGYSSYVGSGFQHLYDVQTLQGGDANWFAEFKHAKNPDAKLRIRMFNQSDTQMMLADARVSPVNYPQVLKYLIARRKGENLSSQFVSVLEPFSESPLIKDVKLVQIGASTETVLEVALQDGSEDRITYLLQQGKPVSDVTVVVRRSAPEKEEGKETGYFAVQSNASLPEPSALVTAVLPNQSAVEIAADPRVANLFRVGDVVRLVNPHHASAHQITAIRHEGPNMILSFADDLAVGLVKVESISGTTLTTSSAVPLFPAYRGVTLSDDLFRFFHPVDHVEEGKITLAKPLPADSPIKPGDKLWLLDVGPGDGVEVPWIPSRPN